MPELPPSASLADVLIFVCALANRFDIDLENAFRAKEAINKNRTWQPAVQTGDGG